MKPIWWEQPTKWLRRLRCRVFCHGPLVTVLTKEYELSHDYCENCGAIIRIHSLRNYLYWYWHNSYEELPEEYAPLYEDITKKKSKARRWLS